MPAALLAAAVLSLLPPAQQVIVNVGTLTVTCWTGKACHQFGQELQAEGTPVAGLLPAALTVCQ